MWSRWDGSPDGAGEPAARLAMGVTLGVLLGIAVDEAGFILAQGASPLRIAAATADFGVLTALQLVHSFPWLPRSSPLLRPLAAHPRRTLAAQALLALAPLAWFGEAWTGAVVFLAGSVLLLLPPRVGWPIWGVLVVGVPLAYATGGPGPKVALASVELAIGSLGVFGLSRAAQLVAEVRRARADIARLAVVTERLRFARDLHEVLGAGLSAITLKCELVLHMLDGRLPTGHLVGGRVDAARQELGAVIRISREVLADVRSVARGYRELSWLSGADPGEAHTSALDAAPDAAPEAAPAAGRAAGSRVALRRPELAPRLAACVLVVLLLGYFVVDAYLVAATPLPGTERAAAVALLALITGLQLCRSFPDRFRRLDGHQFAVLGLQTVLTFAPYPVLGPVWLGEPGFLLGSVLLLLAPGRQAWLVVAAVGAAYTAAQAELGASGPAIVAHDISALMCGLMVFGLTRMTALVNELHRSRSEQARLMVMNERLRFARDLHDLMGLSLATVTLKCELAHRFVADRPEQARQELVETLETARQALAEVRSVARGYQRMSLAVEVETARALLATAGIEATVRLDCGELPADADGVLATVLREGLTNVLRHSTAQHCVVTGERQGPRIVFSLVNDGVPGGTARPDTDGGSGIGNLAGRVDALGGRLTAGVRPDGWFHLSAELSLASTAAPTTASTAPPTPAPVRC